MYMYTYMYIRLTRKKNFFLIGFSVQKFPFHVKKTPLNVYLKILKFKGLATFS